MKANPKASANGGGKKLFFLHKLYLCFYLNYLEPQSQLR